MDSYPHTLEDLPVIIVPIHWEFNLWGFLGLLCILCSAILSGTIILEIILYLTS